MKTYSNTITSLEPNQIFVFGSNTQGRHGKGAALWARQRFGAVYGQARGKQGHSYAIVTKDLTASIHPSRNPFQMLSEIEALYNYALEHTNLEFLVAYSASGTNLNGYTAVEMAAFFRPGILLGHKSIPENIVFEKEFYHLINSQ